MKIKSFEFSLSELAGSMGDFGTLLPLAIGYIAVCGLDPAGLLVMMGLVNIGTGLVYRIPMPVEPMKVIAVAAIAQHWTPSMVYASGFAMGIIWLLFAATGIITRISGLIPGPVIRGIQVSLGVLLAIEAVKMISTWWALGAASIAAVLLLRKSRYAPASIVLIVSGLAIMYYNGQLQQVSSPQFTLPAVRGFRAMEVWQTLLLAGFAQVPLTVSNATIATSSLIKTYWPEKAVSERRLAWNQGIINAVLPFFGGMPTCHGAGGLAGQYFFGARTGGANIIEGLLEITMGLFFSASIAWIFSSFPMAIIGAMMFMVGLELTKFVKDFTAALDIAPMAFTVIVSLAANMFWGMLAGVAVFHVLKIYASRKAGNKR